MMLLSRSMICIKVAKSKEFDLIQRRMDENNSLSTEQHDYFSLKYNFSRSGNQQQ